MNENGLNSVIVPGKLDLEVSFDTSCEAVKYEHNDEVVIHFFIGKECVGKRKYVVVGSFWRRLWSWLCFWK
jgi:hypothetical protein